MKQCPVCRTSYTDDSLSFCLNDGAALAASPDSEITQWMSFGAPGIFAESSTLKNKSAPESSADDSGATRHRSGRQKSNNSLLIVLGFLIVSGIAGSFFIYFAYLKKNDSQAVISSTANLNFTPTPAPNETQVLREKLDQLEKQINEQRNAKNNLPAPTVAPIQPTSAAKTARVNSPNDGYLALRSAPNSKTGYQILQIPHGAAVSVNGCQDYTISGSVRGRWCRVVYSGQEGWAFDAFLIY